jgi:hypothetical protein
MFYILLYEKMINNEQMVDSSVEEYDEQDYLLSDATTLAEHIEASAAQDDVVFSYPQYKHIETKSACTLF